MKSELLIIKNLSLSIENKVILKNLRLTINYGETHVLIGPNGSGKSTLALFLAGYPNYQIKSGEVVFNKQNLLIKPPDQRLKSGLFVSHQNPLGIDGISVSNLLREIINNNLKLHKKQSLDVMNFHRITRPIFKEFNLDLGLLSREYNKNFSGGEKKKAEFIGYLLLSPDLAIFDEIDSGLDFSTLKKLADHIAKNKKKNKSALLISHNPKLIKMIKPDFIHQINKGRLKTRPGN